MPRTTLKSDRVKLAQAPDDQLGLSNDHVLQSLSQFCASSGRPFEELGLMQMLINEIPDYLFLKDRASTYLIVNDSLAQDAGLPNGAALIGKNDFFLHAKPLAQEIYDREQQVMSTGIPMLDVEEYNFNAGGHIQWFLSTKLPVRDKNGNIVGLIGVCRNNTERKQADNFRMQQSDILELIARNHPERLILTRIIQLIEAQIEGAYCSIVLLDETGNYLTGTVAPSLPASYVAQIEGLRIGPTAGSCGAAAYLRQTVIAEDVFEHPNWVPYRELVAPTGMRSCWSSPVLSENGEVLATFGIYTRNVRQPTPNELSLVAIAARLVGIAIERRKTEERIHFMALHDPLTGLPNRVLLKSRLDEAIAASTGTNQRVAIAFLDLDNFKFINDSLGHGAGDVILKELAARMSAETATSETIARIGGDEFIVLLKNCPDDRAAILARIEALRTTVSRPIAIEDRSYSLSASVGVAIYPDDAGDADTLLSNADAAMYRAKALGRDNAQPFTLDLRKDIQAHLLLHNDLKRALTGEGLELFYQPQVDLKTGRVFAVEALVRWNHPVFGLMSPDRFIPMAESSGLIVQLGEWVLHEACRQGAEWQAAGLTDLTVCANISAHQFREGLLERQVRDALNASGFPPDRLELEITESMLMHDEARAIAAMERLRTLGITFSIDDFGTGYSSFATLKSFPVSRIKVDKTFIRDIGEDDNDRAITAAIILMAQKLNLVVVAEGVETAYQEAFLRDNNCDHAQGYRFARPMSATRVRSILDQGRIDPA